MSSKINLVYLTSWVIVISLGMFQFGYAIAMYNIFTKVLFKQYSAEGKEVIKNADDFNSVVTTMVPIGAAFGSFTAGFLCNLGRRNALFIVNGVIIVGSVLTCIFSFWTLSFGRLFIGYGAGAFTVIAPLYVAETCPPEVGGALGAVNQLQVTIGIMIADFLGFIVPYEILEGETTVNPEVYTTQIWRVVFGAPAAIAVIQTLLVLFVFRNDTIKYYEQNGMKDAVERVEALIYKDGYHKFDQDALTDEDSSSLIGKQINESNKSPSNDYNRKLNSKSSSSVEVSKKVSIMGLFSPQYRRAFLTGCVLVFFQQCTGITPVIFYSNDVFTQGLIGYESEKSARIGTLLVGIFNCVSAGFAVPLLTRFGRKTLMIFGEIGMGVSMLLLGIFSIMNEPTPIKVMTMFFVCFFELSIGSILWLYEAEIMPESGMPIVTLLLWIIMTIFSLFTAKFFEWFKPEGVYFGFTGIQVLGLLFIIFFIRETRGKTKEQLKYLYASE